VCVTDSFDHAPASPRPRVRVCLQLTDNVCVCVSDSFDHVHASPRPCVRVCLRLLDNVSAISLITCMCDSDSLTTRAMPTPLIVLVTPTP